MRWLDITKSANIIPPLPWGTYIDNEYERIHQHAEKLLLRHGGTLDPEAYSSIHTMIYYRFAKISLILSVDKQQWIPRPSNLGSYMLVLDEWLNAFISLHDWTVSKYNYLKINNITSVHAPYLFSQLKENDAPSARLEKKEFEQQIQRFGEWGEKKRIKN
jgi:hypothetical protein